jgi:hypothetical protein
MTREQRFFDAVLPALKALAAKWFDPTKRSPDGLFYACGYCDTLATDETGLPRHDSDCLPQLAHDTLEAIAEKEAGVWNAHYDGTARPPEELAHIRANLGALMVLRRVVGSKLVTLIPLDYNEPENRNVVCYCYGFGDRMPDALGHRTDCPLLIISDAVSELYKHPEKRTLDA